MLNSKARRALVLGIIAGGLVFVLVSILVRTNAPVWASPQVQSAIRLPFVLRNYPLPPAPPPAPPIFGISMPQTMTGLDSMAAAGVKWVRTDLYWDNVEPSKGVRNWNMGTNAGLEQGLQAATQQNVNVILIVHTAPGWAQKVSGSGCGPIKSSEFGAFASFVHDAVARYSGAPYNVKYWEIWNEEDIQVQLSYSGFGCWGDPADAYFGGGYYGDMLKVVYPQLKAADTQSQMLVGGLLMDCDPAKGSACTPSKFLEGILRQGGAPYFDGVSFHAYDFATDATAGHYAASGWNSTWNTTGPLATAKVKFIRNLLTQYGASNKYLINSEVAVLCFACSQEWDWYKTTKINYIAQSYGEAIADGLRANVWYNWSDHQAQLYGNSLIAYQFASNKLQGATFIGNVASADLGGATNIKGYKFTHGSQTVWVIWSLDGNAHAATFGIGAPVAVWNPLGTPVAPAATMTITLTPWYLEW